MAERVLGTVPSVIIVAVAVLVGAAAGLLRTPSGAHALRPEIHRVGWLAVAAALNAMAVLLSGDLATAAFAASLVVLAGFAAVNRHVTGVAVVGVGLLLNLAAVGIHGAMPVRPEALARAGVIDAPDDADARIDAPRRVERDGDLVPVLGDVLPVPVTREVLSFGDLLIAVGVADAVRALTRRRRSRPELGLVEVDAYIGETTAARALQVWGTAPSGRAVSASQYSAKPDSTAPVTSDFDSDAAMSASPALVAAHQSR